MKEFFAAILIIAFTIATGLALSGSASVVAADFMTNVGKLVTQQ